MGSDQAECLIRAGLCQKQGRFSGLNLTFRGQKERFNSMFKFLLICPTPALELNFDPRNTPGMPVIKISFRLGFEKIS